MTLFSDPVHAEFADWALGLAPYGGGDVGEVRLLASQVKAGDDDSFFDAFVGLAKRRIEEGDAAAGKGRALTARDCYLRAALGRLLIDEGLTLRHDWEKVVTPVVDAALGIDVVDPDRIVYEAGASVGTWRRGSPPSSIGWPR